MKKDKFRKKFLSFFLEHLIRHFILEDEVLLVSNGRAFLIER